MRLTRVAVVGAAGQVGTAMVRLLGDSAKPLTRKDLDLATVDIDDALDCLAGTDAVINCAAYTAVDAAEQDESLATAINGRAVGVFAEAAHVLGVPFTTFSTDYVFDGGGARPYVESDPTAPINAYGRSKLDGELRALAAHPASLVVRTSWVLSSTHPNFVTAILRRARSGQELNVVSDQLGRPTIADDLARVTLELVESGTAGIVHLANSGEATWFDVAVEVVERAGLDRDLVSPCSTEDYPTTAARPAYSVLGSERVDVDNHLPDWRSSIGPVVFGSLHLLGVDGNSVSPT